MDIPQNMFVTCFYSILEAEKRHLSYANAMNDLPYLYCRSGEAEELRARGTSLGLMPGRSYEEKETILQADEAALFYSDGLVEVMTLRVRCSAFQGCARSCPSTVRRVRWGFPDGSSLLLRGGGLGAGGQHHPSDATMSNRKCTFENSVPANFGKTSSTTFANKGKKEAGTDESPSLLETSNFTSTASAPEGRSPRSAHHHHNLLAVNSGAVFVALSRPRLAEPESEHLRWHHRKPHR